MYFDQQMAASHDIGLIKINFFSILTFLPSQAEETGKIQKREKHTNQGFFQHLSATPKN